MKSIRIFTLLYVLLFLLIGCQQEKEPVSVTGITLSQSSFSMIEGEVHTLTVNIEPSNADNKSVFWTSSQESVASVQDGVVSAYKSGNTTITAKSVDGGKTATCEVIVLAKEISVESVSLDKTSVEMTEGDEITLAATITPDNATNKNVIWTSSDERIVSVDNGKVTAILEGTATITVTTEDGRMAAFCSITVLCPENSVNYIDEYGINQGKGVMIDGVIWAPVNCGYHETDYPYGKLYQWSRRYGQGYSGIIYDISKNIVGTYSDDLVPSVESGLVSLSTGQAKNNSNVFYMNEDYPYDWLSAKGDNLWNAGTESDPAKTEYDPCPEGWRVPTYAELDNLRENYSSWITDENGQIGYWFSGSNPYSFNSPRVFFPAAGYRHCCSGDAEYRGYLGEYWSSRPASNYSALLILNSSDVGIGGSSRAFGCSVRCVQDDSELIPVSSLSINESSLTMEIGETQTLSSTISPSNANHKTAYWWSGDERVATVDETGKVTAVYSGVTTITAMAGMKLTTCSVTVNAPAYIKDYIDESGVNHGPGVEIDGVVWAPVNCGYHKTNFKYGKLYQWGRKYGQGYSGSIYDINGNIVGTYSDASVPSVESGPVSLDTGQSKSNSNVFYTNENYPWDWVYSQYDHLWNAGTESSSIETEYNPCPEGWRVPTYAELDNLNNHYSPWMTDENGQIGRWFSGSCAYSSNSPRVFFPAAGSLYCLSGSAFDRGYSGYYWSSRPDGNYSINLYLDRDNVGEGNGGRANGNSVRCVQK